MNLIIYGKNVQLTEAIKRYIEEKIGRIEHFFEETEDQIVHVSVSVLRDHHRVEVTIPLSNNQIRAAAETEDMYKSIDKVEEKVKRQIRKFKTKINRKQRKEAPSSSKHAKDENRKMQSIKTNRFTKPMNVQEAILQMNLFQLDHLYFLDDITNEIRAVYKHQDGEYGLITPTFTNIINRVG